jgi:hypothetical protein
MRVHLHTLDSHVWPLVQNLTLRCTLPLGVNGQLKLPNNFHTSIEMIALRKKKSTPNRGTSSYRQILISRNFEAVYVISNAISVYESWLCLIEEKKQDWNLLSIVCKYDWQQDSNIWCLCFTEYNFFKSHSFPSKSKSNLGDDKIILYFVWSCSKWIYHKYIQY